LVYGQLVYHTHPYFYQQSSHTRLIKHAYFLIRSRLAIRPAYSCSIIMYIHMNSGSRELIQW